MEKSSYDLFCEHMQRYEAGECNLNEEEKKQEEFLASTGKAFQPLAFDTFLENMNKYQENKKGKMHR